MRAIALLNLGANAGAIIRATPEEEAQLKAVLPDFREGKIVELPDGLCEKLLAASLVQPIKANDSAEQAVEQVKKYKEKQLAT